MSHKTGRNGRKLYANFSHFLSLHLSLNEKNYACQNRKNSTRIGERVDAIFVRKLVPRPNGRADCLWQWLMHAARSEEYFNFLSDPLPHWTCTPDSTTFFINNFFIRAQETYWASSEARYLNSSNLAVDIFFLLLENCFSDYGTCRCDGRLRWIIKGGMDFEEGLERINLSPIFDVLFMSLSWKENCP